jgi:hypothetical protein
MGKLGAKASVTSSKLEGACVKTMVSTSPNRRARRAAAKCERTLATRAPKKRSATTPSPAVA